MCAAKAPASVYFFDHDTTLSDKTPTLRPDDAKLLISQRLRVSQSYNLESADENVISYLNRFSAPQRLLSSSEKQVSERAKLLVVVEGVEPINGQTGSCINLLLLYMRKLTNTVNSVIRDEKPAFQIIDPPPPSFNRKLVHSLAEQLRRAPEARRVSTSDINRDGYFMEVACSRMVGASCSTKSEDWTEVRLFRVASNAVRLFWNISVINNVLKAKTQKASLPL